MDLFVSLHFEITIAAPDGRLTHHRAVRNDSDLLLQLGWRPGGRS